MVKDSKKRETKAPPWGVITVVLVLMWMVARSRPQPMPRASAASTPYPAEASQSAAGHARRLEYGQDTVSNPPPNPYNSPSLYDYRGGRTEQYGMGKQYVVDSTTLVPLEQMETLFAEGKWSELRDYCGQLIASNPDWPTPHFYYAIAIGKLGDPDEAVERLEEVKKAFPNVFVSIDHWLIRFRGSDRPHQPSPYGGHQR